MASLLIWWKDSLLLFDLQLWFLQHWDFGSKRWLRTETNAVHMDTVINIKEDSKFPRLQAAPEDVAQVMFRENDKQMLSFCYLVD